MKSNRHIVDYNKYCATCKFKEASEWDYEGSPCPDCLDQPYNYDSHKPILWEGRDEQK